MSKIICDICGTSYPETATQCPICGCVRSSDVTVVSGDTNVTEASDHGTYTYVKGGRFSKANVRKRTQGNRSNVASEPELEPELPKKEKGDRDTGLVVAVCVLLLAIVSAVIYIAIHFFSQTPAQPDVDPMLQDTSNTTSVVETTTNTTSSEIACTDVLVSKTSLEFTEAGATSVLVVTKNPADTTDELVFTSSDEAVATVSSDGVVEAVGDGEAVITISCGSATAECKVTCAFPTTETTEATQAESSDETEATEQTSEYTLSHTDVTLFLSGEEHLKSFRLTLKDSEGNEQDVDWVVGDPSVCEVSGNTVKAKQPGYTKVKVTINDVTYACIVRVR